MSSSFPTWQEERSEIGARCLGNKLLQGGYSGNRFGRGLENKVKFRGRETEKRYFESDCWALLLVAHNRRHGFYLKGGGGNLHVLLLCSGGFMRLSKLVCIHEN
jgi:hypothetical protein